MNLVPISTKLATLLNKFYLFLTKEFCEVSNFGDILLHTALTLVKQLMEQDSTLLADFWNIAIASLGISFKATETEKFQTSFSTLKFLISRSSIIEPKDGFSLSYKNYQSYELKVLKLAHWKVPSDFAYS